jgi:hypothetical protein
MFLSMEASTEHPMNFTEAIKLNTETLIGIIAALFAMLGLEEPDRGGDRSKAPLIPKNLRAAALRILRPAEAAVRRLIFVSAKSIVLKPAVSRPMPAGGIQTNSTGSGSNRPPPFKLDDPRVPMVVSANQPLQPTVHKLKSHLAASGPRISMVAPADPTVAGLWTPPAFAADQSQSLALATDGIRSAHLIRRLHAIRAALQNLPHQAKRLARWTARRERLTRHHPVYTSPLRSGNPPGYKREPIHEIEHVLKNCHWLAFDLRTNTS